MLTSLAKKNSNLIALERGLSRATQVLAPCPPSGALNSQMLTPPQNIKVFINKNRSNRWFPARVCVGVLLLFPGPRLNSHKSVPRSYPLQYERFSPNQQRAQPQKKIVTWLPQIKLVIWLLKNGTAKTKTSGRPGHIMKGSLHLVSPRPERKLVTRNKIINLISRLYETTCFRLATWQVGF